MTIRDWCRRVYSSMMRSVRDNACSREWWDLLVNMRDNLWLMSSCVLVERMWLMCTRDWWNLFVTMRDNSWLMWSCVLVERTWLMCAREWWDLFVIMRASHTNVIQKSPECYPIVTHWHIAAINEMMRSVVDQGLPTFGGFKVAWGPSHIFEHRVRSVISFKIVDSCIRDCLLSETRCFSRLSQVGWLTVLQIDQLFYEE